MLLQVAKILLYTASIVALVKIAPLLRKLHFKKSGFEVDIDFVVDDETTRNRFKWRGVSEATEKSSLKFEDFVFFIRKKLYLQVPLSENDLANFKHLDKVSDEKFLPVARSFYSRSYVFNVKFEHLSKLVEDYKRTENEVLKK